MSRCWGVRASCRGRSRGDTRRAGTMLTEAAAGSSTSIRKARMFIPSLRLNSQGGSARQGKLSTRPFEKRPGRRSVSALYSQAFDRTTRRCSPRCGRSWISRRSTRKRSCPATRICSGRSRSPWPTISWLGARPWNATSEGCATRERGRTSARWAPEPSPDRACLPTGHTRPQPLVSRAHRATPWTPSPTGTRARTTPRHARAS